MRTLTIGAAVLIAFASVSAQITIRPGLYEYTFDLDLGPKGKAAGDAVLGAVGLDKEKRRECITADELKGDLTKLFAQEMEEQGCKMSNVKTSGNTLSFTTVCDDITGTTEITVGTDSFTSAATFKDPDGVPRTSRIVAKRLGDCPK